MDRRQFMVGASAAAAAASIATPARAARGGHGPLFDSHLHFFTNDIAHYPLDTRNAREPAEVMRQRVMRDPGTSQKIFALWQVNGVGGGVGVQYSGAYKTDNRYLLDQADAHPDRIAAEIIVDARNSQSPAEIERLARTRHVASIRLTGYADDAAGHPWLASDAALNVWAAAERLGLPIGITYLPPAPGSGAIGTVERLARKFPGATVVLVHLGWVGAQGDAAGLLPAHHALRDLPNLRFKWTTINIDQLCAAGVATSAFLRSAVDLFGAERLMWGSDFGNTLRPYEGMVADAFGATVRLTARERDAVLHGSGIATFRRNPSGGRRG